MLQACDQRFDVTENLENFCELNKALYVLDICWLSVEEDEEAEQMLRMSTGVLDHRVLRRIR